ncbi:MAG: hypothetical protein TH68_04850, partial [Candidatus Synechococcus spongiarum 142]
MTDPSFSSDQLVAWRGATTATENTPSAIHQAVS